MSCQVHVVILIPPSAYVECIGKIVTQNDLLDNWYEQRKGNVNLSSPITNVKSHSSLLVIKSAIDSYYFYSAGIQFSFVFCGDALVTIARHNTFTST